MDDRRYPDRPFIGVGAIVFEEDRVLLIRRGKDPGQGKWSIPGGVVHPGETLARAVGREVEEETGLLVKTECLVEVFERIIPDEQERILYHYVLIDYLCRATGGRLKAGSDALEAAFYPLKALDRLELTSGAGPVILKAFKAKTEILS
jgi:ADP-ribose pyrophosphatase YjhB (NUDIX family)